MALHPQAGQPAPRSTLADIPRLLAAYHSQAPDPRIAAQQVAFGTSGHRGSALTQSFNEAHILAITQAICDYRRRQGINGPLFLGKDTHALSEPARVTAIEVLAANGVDVFIDEHDGYTPTPVISQAILSYNHGRRGGLADGILITPSHNPPEDGGFKYNPPNGGPADTDVTGTIERAANALLESGARDVKRWPFARALAAPTTHKRDYVTPYLAALATAIDLDAIRAVGPKLGADPLGGASVAYWQRLATDYGLNLSLVDDTVDPTFGFMRLDHDGKIRMDCSSEYAMAGLVAMKDHYDVAFGNDADADRHGIVVPSTGLMNPNHYLAVAISYLFAHRRSWPSDVAIGKTLVSSSLIDRVAKKLGKQLVEVPVGFKWFVEGLYSGTLGFGGEESAGASFLRRDGTVWTTDKDGILLCLLAAEIRAVTDRDPGELYRELTAELGEPVYQRIDSPATPAQKKKLKALSPQQVSATTLAGESITAKLTKAPGNDASIGGLKVQTENGWFAARPSGTENVYKIYAESFKGPEHLKQIQREAAAIVHGAMGDD